MIIKKIIIILILLITCHLILAGKTINIGSPKVIGVIDVPPQVFIDKNGIAKGVFIDILEYIAKEEKWDLFYKSGTLNQSQDWLTNNEIDIMVDLGYSVERSKKFVFSKESVISTWAQVYSRKGLEIYSVLDLKNKKIAVVKGNYFYRDPKYGIKYLLKQLGSTATFIEVGSYKDVLQLLDEGIAEIGIVNRLYGVTEGHKYSIEKTSVIFSPVSLCFAFPKNGRYTKYLKPVIDEYLKKLKKDKNSIYYQTVTAHTNITTVEVETIPEWLIWLIGAIVALLSFLFGFSMILRIQVNKKTVELKQEKDFVEQLIDISPIGIFAVDQKGKIIYANKRAEIIIGVTLDSVLNKRFYETNWLITDFNDKKIPFQQLPISIAMETKTTVYKSLLKFSFKKEDFKYLSVNASPLFDQENKMKRVICAFEDITEIIAYEKELETSLNENNILLKEVHHRVKNNLQLISSMIGLQTSGITDEHSKEIFYSNTSRIRSMALIHEKLYQREKVSALHISEFIESLKNDLQQLYDVESKKICIDTDVDDILIGIDQAIPFGLIVNELISNALRHAFPQGRDSCEINVTIKKLESKELELRIYDNGQGFGAIDVENPETFGIKMINILSEQLKGKLVFSSENGVDVTLSFPIYENYN